METFVSQSLITGIAESALLRKALEAARDKDSACSPHGCGLSFAGRSPQPARDALAMLHTLSTGASGLAGAAAGAQQGRLQCGGPQVACVWGTNRLASVASHRNRLQTSRARWASPAGLAVSASAQASSEQAAGTRSAGEMSWKGHRISYERFGAAQKTKSGDEKSPGKEPVVVIVHGFGAHSQQPRVILTLSSASSCLDPRAGAMQRCRSRAESAGAGPSSQGFSSPPPRAHSISLPFLPSAASTAGSNSAHFADFATRLATRTGLEVICPDLIGFGESEVRLRKQHQKQASLGAEAQPRALCFGSPRMFGIACAPRRRILQRVGFALESSGRLARLCAIRLTVSPRHLSLSASEARTAHRSPSARLPAPPQKPEGLTYNPYTWRDLVVDFIGENVEARTPPQSSQQTVVASLCFVFQLSTTALNTCLCTFQPGSITGVAARDFDREQHRLTGASHCGRDLGATVCFLSLAHGSDMKPPAYRTFPNAVGDAVGTLIIAMEC